MNVDALATALRQGDRRALARAVTLIESTRQSDRDLTAQLLQTATHIGDTSLRLGLSGAPGVGKSTLIEALGMRLIERGERVAVLAVDPSSSRTGGSILGDKTRMERLSRHPNAFIRPSPARAELGGVARRTREAIRLCEAADFSIVIVETVGVGQSETTVADLTDVFALLINPAGGDDLQGVKRGVMERADLVLVNKADGDTATAARATVSDYANALNLLRMRPDDPPPETLAIPAVLPISAATGLGVDEAWERIAALAAWRNESGWRDRRRRMQNRQWVRREIERELIAAFEADNDAKEALRRIDAKISDDAPTFGMASKVVRRFLLGDGDQTE